MPLISCEVLAVRATLSLIVEDFNFLISCDNELLNNRNRIMHIA